MNAPYLLIPIGITLLILYGYSLLFSRIEVITRSLHRRLWNYALLLTFLVSAILGILMAVQVNYRMEVPWTEKVLKWHVNFGIGMSAIGIFHFLWHWRYYFPWKSSPGRLSGGSRKDAQGLVAERWRVPAVVFPVLIGFTGVTFQTFLIRELPGLFHGNELMLSIILMLWLLITGAGAMTGSRTAPWGDAGFERIFGKSWLIVLSLPVVSILSTVLLYITKVIFFAPGIEAGPLAFSGFVLLILFPFCFINGFALTYVARTLGPAGLDLRKAYVWESIGGAVAGVICTAAILAGFFGPPFGKRIEKMQHPNEEIVAVRSGAAGKLAITRSGDLVNVYENGVLAQSTGNTLICEEMAHFAMTRHPDPKRVLVIGGSLSGVHREVVKYPVERIDLTEPDPSVLRLASRMGLVGDSLPVVRLIRKNPASWIHQPEARYDVILVMLPGPQSLSINRFYTKGFFRQLKECLTSGGVVSVMLPGTANYLSDEAVAAIGPVMAAMQLNFRDVSLYPGENNYVLAADLLPDAGILATMEYRGIQGLYLSAGYFDERKFSERQIQFNELIDKDMEANTDLKPIAFLGQIAWWMGHFPDRTIWPLAVLCLVILVGGIASRQSALTAIFLMGAAIAGLEVMLLLLLQISAGTLYLYTGLLLAVFMAGLAVGSSEGPAKKKRYWTEKHTSAVILFIIITLLTGVLAVWLTRSGYLSGLKSIGVAVIAFAAAWVTGRFFAILVRRFPDSGTSGRVYAFDLLGASVGALAFPMVVIPLFGLLAGAGIISAAGVVILLVLMSRR